MEWEAQFYPASEGTVLAVVRDVRVALLAVVKLLSDCGPQFGQRRADALKGSRYANMKELRFEVARMVNGAPPLPSAPREGQSC